jgi:endonuclease G
LAVASGNNKPKRLRKTPRRSTSSQRDQQRPVSPSGTNLRSSNEGNLLLGNPSNAGRSEDNFLLERPQYSLSYNRGKGGPNWVAWHTDASNLGRVDRKARFAPDPDLPSAWQIRSHKLQGFGYDRWPRAAFRATAPLRAR